MLQDGTAGPRRLAYPQVEDLDVRRSAPVRAPTASSPVPSRLFQRRRIQHFARVDGVIFAYQKLEARTRPCEVVALTSGRIRLDHGIDARSLERTLGEIGFDLRPALVNDHQIRVIHASILRAAGAASSR